MWFDRMADVGLQSQVSQETEAPKESNPPKPEALNPSLYIPNLNPAILNI